MVNSLQNNPTLELLSEVHFYNSTVEFKVRFA